MATAKYKKYLTLYLLVCKYSIWEEDWLNISKRYQVRTFEKNSMLLYVTFLIISFVYPFGLVLAYTNNIHIFCSIFLRSIPTIISIAVVVLSFIHFCLIHYGCKKHPLVINENVIRKQIESVVNKSNIEISYERDEINVYESICNTIKSIIDIISVIKDLSKLKHK